MLAREIRLRPLRRATAGADLQPASDLHLWSRADLRHTRAAMPGSRDGDQDSGQIQTRSISRMAGRPTAQTRVVIWGPGDRAMQSGVKLGRSANLRTKLELHAGGGRPTCSPWRDGAPGRGGDHQPKAELQLGRQDTIQTGLGSWGPAGFAAQRTAVASPGTSTSHSLWKTPSHQHRLLATTTHDTSTRGRAETQNQLRTALARPHKQKTTRPQRKIGERHAARARAAFRPRKICTRLPPSQEKREHKPM